MQGLLYPEGPIGQALQAILIVWSGYEGKDYLLPNRNNPPLLKAASILLLMYCVYGIPLILFNPYGVSRPHYYLQSYLASFMTVILFYRYLKEGYLTEDRLKKYIWIFLVVVIWHYFKCHQEMIAKLRRRGSGAEEVTNNAGYEFLGLLPMTFFFYKKPIFQYSLLCLIMLFIVMAMKRGPILIGAVCFVWTLIVNIKAAENKKHRYMTLLLGFSVVLMGFAYVSYQLSNSDYMNKRIEETQKGESSGRDHLYSNAIDLLVNDNSYSNLLIGHGADSTVGLLGKRAHQDWLETAINNGLCGVCVLLYLCVCFAFTVLKKKGNVPKQIHTAFQVLYFIFISKTMFSMSLADMPCFQSMFISFCVFYCSTNNHVISN